jgi:hypothetical protein
MDSENLREKMIEITVGEKHYVLLPLCSFHDIPSFSEGGEWRETSVEKQFGLRDLYATVNVYEIIDPKKVIMAKIKYGM